MPQTCRPADCRSQLLLLIFAACSLLSGQVQLASAEHVWVVQLEEGGEMAAREIASSYAGLEYQGRVPHLRNKFVFRWSGESVDSSSQEQAVHGRQKRDIAEQENVHRRLTEHPKITWISYQKELKREKRDFIQFEEREAPGSSQELKAPVSRPGNRAVSDFSPWQLNRHADRIFTDPLWPKQWYLHDTRTSPKQPKLDLHVIPAWRRNFTGRGVVVAVVDDGLEIDHPDLVANYDPKASYNFNQNNPDPSPRYADLDNERHGTRCAGEVSMSANNSHCGVGVAFNARIGGIKILDGHVSDLLEARGLNHALDHVDIYSASWGPPDDGRTLEGPGPLAAEALQVGSQRGRGGKGALYVWAAGNGGAFGDNCNCDGYAASIYTIAVSSVSQRLTAPWYSEHCSAILATAFSSGSSEEQKMASTDLKHRCTEGFTGTSASAPVAAGIVALLLEANPSLTWRDVQHVIAWTTEVAPLLGNPGWQRNAAGHMFHPQFGFGLFNVGAMADLVASPKWRTVAEKETVELDKWQCSSDWRLRAAQAKPIRCELTVGRKVEDRVKYLEHVQLRVKMTYPERGALAVYLVSASGTRSQLLTRRAHDTSDNGLPSWAFLSVHFWGENPAGKWHVEIEDQGSDSRHEGSLQDLALILHGTVEAPEYRVEAGGYRQYNQDYNSVKNMRVKDLTRPAKASRSALQTVWTSSTIDYSDRRTL